MQGTLIYTHTCGMVFEIMPYLDVSLAKQCKMWRHRRQGGCDHDWSSGWSRVEDCVSAIDDACYDLLPREGEPEPPSSVISDGHYLTMIYEGKFPHCEPKEIPHYE